MSGYGMRGHVMVQPQTVWNGSLTTSMEAIAVTESSLVKGIEQVPESGMYGRFDESPYHDGFQTFNGEMTQEANPIGIGWFAKSVLNETSTTSDTNKQTHVFKPRTSDFSANAAQTPFTIEQNLDVGSAGLFTDMCGNTLSINIANGELLTFTMGWIGAGFTRKAAGSPIYPVAKPFKWDQASGSFNGASIIDLLDLTININNNLEAKYTLQNCSVPRKIKRAGFRTIELSGNMLFQAHSYWQNFEAQQEIPFNFNFKGSQANNNLFLEFPALRLKTYEPTLAGPGVIEASFTAQALYSTDSATAMAMTLVNTALYLP